MFNKSADLKTINGTDTMLTKLTKAVRVTESATSPFANFVKTLEVTPPGAAAIIITPSANSIGVLNDLIRIKAMIGSKVNWQIIPIIKSFGLVATLLKS